MTITIESKGNLTLAIRIIEPNEINMITVMITLYRICYRLLLITTVLNVNRKVHEE